MTPTSAGSGMLKRMPAKSKKPDFKPPHKNLLLATRIFGAVGTLILVADVIRNPTWPTPDKIFVLLTLVFMIFGRGWKLFKRLGPFVGLLLVYESFRSIVPQLNGHVNYRFLPAADKFLFRVDPTHWLQQHWWNGHVQWYDFFFYGFYMLHFILPISLALVIWKLRDKDYWRYIVTYLTVSFSAFIMFLVFPAAPPWMASELHIITPITRITSHVWQYLGIKDFPSLYNKLSPNPVAAMPSLHAAYATIFLLYVYKLFGKKWAALAAIYPLSIYLGTVYQGEHYVIDEIAGILFGVGAYFAAPYVLKGVTRAMKYTARKLQPLAKRLQTRTDSSGVK